MPRLTLALRVDPLDRFTHDPAWDAKLEFPRALYRSLGLPTFSNVWTQLDLASPVLSDVTATLESLRSRGVATAGSGVLSERPTEREEANTEWFVFRGFDHAGFNLLPYPTGDCARLLGGTPLVDGGRFASERVRSLVEAEGFTGIEFLQVRDTGRFRAPKWYAVIAQEPMGFGVDHPWCDRDKLLHDLTSQGMEIEYVGISRFDKRIARDGWSAGSELADRLLATLPGDSPLGLSIETQPRFVRDDLPDTDFAYVWQEGVLAEEGGERYRLLAFRRRVRNALLATGAVRAEELDAVVLVGRADAGAYYPAPGTPTPPPALTVREMASLRAQERAVQALAVARPKPERRPDLKRALRLLRAAKRRRPHVFSRGAQREQLERLVSQLGPLPDDWREVLRVSAGGHFGMGDTACEVVTPDELPDFHAELLAVGRSAHDDYPATVLHVARTPTGDYYVLDRGAEMAKECPVVLFSHETCAPERRWSNVAAFLEEMLAG